MTTLDPLHPVQSCIVELLAECPGMSVSDLHGRLKQACGVDVSLQNLYRTISQMIESQILFREKGHLSLNLVWTSHFTRLADAMRRLYLSNEKDILDLPMKDGDRREFFAESLGALDPLWNHAIRKVAAIEQGKEWYEYNAHAYHLLGMKQTEERLYESLGAGHKVYGNDTFLDRYGAKFNPQSKNIVITSDTPFLSEGYCLWLCGDFLIDCVFPETLTKHFALFFQSVKSIDQFQPELFADIFRMKARCRLLVWKSAREAQLLRTKFAPFFPKPKAKKSKEYSPHFLKKRF